MKARLFVLAVAAFMLCIALAHGQSDNMIHVKEFKGATVGAKVSAAMRSCPSSVVPCFVVVDASLAASAPGVMPSLCGNCYLLDYRFGVPTAVSGVGQVMARDGVSADVLIAQCFAAYSICDARGFGATTQTVAATVDIGAGGANQSLILSPDTFFQPASATLDMFKLERNGQLTGLHVVFPAAMVYTGKAVSVRDTVTVGNALRLDGVTVDATAEASGGVGGGYCLYLEPPSGSYIQLVNFSNVTCNGLLNGLYLKAAGTNGYINGNNFLNFVLMGNGNLLTFYSTGLQMNGNTFANFQFDGLGPAITYKGTSSIRQNVFTSSYIWDTSTPVLNQNNGSSNNLFWGSVDHAITDSSSVASFAPYANVYEIGLSGRLADGTLVNNGNFQSQFSSSDYVGGVAYNTIAGGHQYFWGSSGGWQGPLGSFFIADGSGDFRRLLIDKDGNFGVGYNLSSALTAPFHVSNTGDATAATLAAGSTVVYRCAVAGTLPVGALTVNTASCGAGPVDTGLRVK
jgi:hypothetical protein